MEAPAPADSLESIHALIQRFWSSGLEVDGASRMRFETAVAEIAANIVEHGGSDHEARWLRLTLRAFRDRVEALFQDDGSGVDVAGLDAALPGEWATRGRGVALVRSMVDEFAYARSNGINHWLIVKRLRPPT